VAQLYPQVLGSSGTSGVPFPVPTIVGPWGVTNSAENSEVYDLWTDCREDSAFGIVGCLAITRKWVPSGLGLARYQATSTPRRACHSIQDGRVSFLK
jgi:hypothetical protein